MSTSPESTILAEDIILADRELDQRNLDGLTVILWWVQNTLTTYVTIEDAKGMEHGEPADCYRIDVPEGVTPKEVFDHPFTYLTGTEDGRGTN